MEKKSVSTNIFLVGLMGAGKTSVGKLLSKKLKLPFFDSDHVIEDRTGVKIMVIFDIEGEAGFRSREHAVLHELTKKKGIVLATGGGAILNIENRRVLQSRGTVIYLHASVGELVRRTKYDSKRPLLQTDDVEKRLTELYFMRDPLYREVADLVFETKNQSIGDLVQHIYGSIIRVVETKKRKKFLD